jgi:hypothetical protein
MTVFALGNTVLLVGVWTCNAMRNPLFLEECIEVTIFPTPIRLDMANFVVKEALYMSLKLKEYIKNIRLVFQ